MTAAADMGSPYVATLIRTVAPQSARPRTSPTVFTTKEDKKLQKSLELHSITRTKTKLWCQTAATAKLWHHLRSLTPKVKHNKLIVCHIPTLHSWE